MAGRPSRLEEVVHRDDGSASTMRQEIIALAKVGAKPALIADRLRLGRTTLWNWLNWGDPDWVPGASDEVPEDRSPYMSFVNEYRDAQAVPAIWAEAAWLNAAKGGDWRGAKAWLHTHRPEEYPPDGIDVKHSGSLDVQAVKITEALKAYDAVIGAIVGDADPADG